MAQLNLTSGDLQLALQTGNFTKVLSAISRACQKFDYDSGWQAVPTGGIVTHGLGILPASILAYGSATNDGSNYQNLAVSKVTSSSVTVAAGTAFIRVLANR